MEKMTVGERIKDLREKMKLTQNGLAERAGISQSHLRRVELGQSGITVEHLRLICDVFNITLSDFFAYENVRDEASEIIATLTPMQQKRLLEFLKSLSPR